MANPNAPMATMARVARRRDVIDAALVLLASDGDVVVTFDPRDLARLARTAGLAVDIVDA